MAHTAGLLASEVAPINAELRRLRAVVAAGPGAGEQALDFRTLGRYSSVRSATCISQEAAPPTSPAETARCGPPSAPGSLGLALARSDICRQPAAHSHPSSPTAPAWLWDNAHSGRGTTRPGFGRGLCWSTPEDARKGGGGGETPVP